jgi:hypothetical protein
VEDAMKKFLAIALALGFGCGVVIPSSVDAAHYALQGACSHSTQYVTTSPMQQAAGYVLEGHSIVRHWTSTTGSHYIRRQVYYKMRWEDSYRWVATDWFYTRYCGELW